LKLIIFDMDQTLVDFLNIHDQSTKAVFKKFFGVDASLREVDFSGKSLSENFLQLAAVKGISREKVELMGRETMSYYEECFGKLLSRQKNKAVLPGVKELLNELVKSGHFVVLYTGDSEGVVNHVFRFTGLGKFFQFAVFGNQAKTRDGMIRLAVEKAERLTGKKFQGKDVVVIGDSTRDIDAGKEVKALTISVATGFHSADELKKHEPDYLFNSLSDYRKIVDIITSNSDAKNKTIRTKRFEKRLTADITGDCMTCRLKLSRPVLGEGPPYAEIMLIGQNPGAEEEKQGRPFVGRSGKYLDKVLKKVGLKREEMFITSVVKCRTEHNRRPTRGEIQGCMPFLIAQIKQIKPRLIVLMGSVAWQVPRLDGIKYIETYHPAAAMRFPRIRQKFENDFEQIKGVL
jgi:HAD superfamily hydrolase (TIGR01549 family)